MKFYIEINADNIASPEEIAESLKNTLTTLVLPNGHTLYTDKVQVDYVGEVPEQAF